MAKTFTRQRSAIAKKVRELRQSRRWTQGQLARQLGISQSYLSEIEAGKGSFTAEQFLEILRLFNQVPEDFVAEAPKDELQNALARLGAAHLRETGELPSSRLRDASGVVKEVLTASPFARNVTALAPVLVANVDQLLLRKLQVHFVELGLTARLAWLVENTLEAIRAQPHALDAGVRNRYRRAELVLASFLASLPRVESNLADVLDPDIRTTKTLKDVEASRSPISRRWGIVSRLTPGDFAEALEGSRVVG